jgi:hypothetical protein
VRLLTEKYQSYKHPVDWRIIQRRQRTLREEKEILERLISTREKYLRIYRKAYAALFL